MARERVVVTHGCAVRNHGSPIHLRLAVASACSTFIGFRSPLGAQPSTYGWLFNRIQLPRSSCGARGSAIHFRMAAPCFKPFARFCVRRLRLSQPLSGGCRIGNWVSRMIRGCVIVIHDCGCGMGVFGFHFPWLFVRRLGLSHPLANGC